MLEYIKKSKNPKILIVTPLRQGDRISKKTLDTINNNKLSFDWISYSGPYNIPTNTTIGMEIYRGIYKKSKIKYMIKIDNDIYANPGLLDDMYKTLHKTDKNIAYCYCPFKFIIGNGREISFPYREFDEERLLRSNYITSNSLIKLEALDDIGGLVCDSYYERLCDWALWLSFLKNFYIGICCKTGFTTPLQEGSISARGEKDYQIKSQRVLNDFIRPLS